MTAFTKIACALILTGGLAAPVWAAPGDAGSGPTTGATATNDAGSGPTNGAASTNKSNSQSSMNGQNGMNGQNDMNGQNGMNQSAMNGGPGGMKIRQKLKSDLTNAGFSDIQIMPQSFLVRAKDSQGNPVIMMINPDSVTAITEQSQANNANHPNNANNNNANNAGATPGPQSTGGSQATTPGGNPKP